MAKAPLNEQASRKPKTNQTEDRRIGEYPSYLRGLATNRYGGNTLQQERGLNGNTYGAAGPCRVYTHDQRKEYERELRQRGILV
jgi:hypothetical protein